jgi:hypothetical protein
MMPGDELERLIAATIVQSTTGNLGTRARSLRRWQYSRVFLV